MSEVDSSLVKQGFWIDHAKGNVLGATLTLKQTSANLIVALLAMIVQIATGSAWNLLMFVVHQLRTTTEARDVLYHQQQVLCRTLGTPGSMMTDLVKLFMVWRWKIQKPALRCLMPALFCLCFALCSLVAGVFSSSVLATTNLEVILSGSECRYLNGSVLDSEDVSMAMNNEKRKVYNAARSYADQCYSSDAVPSRCKLFVKSRITSSVSASECPFPKTMCALEKDPAISLDTGYLNSLHDFGINTLPADRVRIRRQATCAPLNTSAHTGLISGTDPRMRTALRTDPLPDEDFWLLQYGRRRAGNGLDLPNNTTMWQSTLKSNTTAFYTVVSAEARQFNQDIFTTFNPIDELRRVDADVTVIFILLDNAASLRPIDDPVYSAHRFGNFTTKFDGKVQNTTSYLPDRPAGVLGCVQQHEYCVASSNDSWTCTEPMGVAYDNVPEIMPSANSMQIATLSVIGEGIAMNTFSGGTATNPPYLDALTYIRGFFLDRLPADQWKKDIEKLNNFAWAAIQHRIVDRAAGLPESCRPFTVPARTAGESQLCRSQKIVKAGGFANINVFALAFTFSVAVFLMVLDFGALRGLILIGKVKSRLSPGIQFWIQDGVFKLQRATFESIAVGTWGRKDKEVPWTIYKDQMYSLALQSPATSASP